MDGPVTNEGAQLAQRHGMGGLVTNEGAQMKDGTYT